VEWSPDGTERKAPFARRGRWLRALGFAAALAVGSVAGATENAPKRFFVGPSPRGGIDDYKQLFKANASWDWVKRHAHVFEMHVNSLRPLPSLPGYLDDASLVMAQKALAKSDFEVGVIAGGLRKFKGSDNQLNWFQAGELQARKEIEGLRRWASVGGEVDVLLLDSPFSHIMEQVGMPWHFAAYELADYLDEIATEFPELEVGFIEPIPRYTIGSFTTFNEIAYGDLRDLFSTVLPILEARGHAMSFFLADSPYSYTEGTPQGWRKLVAAEVEVERWGMTFGWFVNDNVGGGTSNELFYANALDGLRKLAEAGGNPDQFNIRSWYDYPAIAVPEHEPFSFTWTAGELMRFVYANFVSQDPQSVTISFDDGVLGGMDLVKGQYVVQDGGLEILSNSHFTLPRQMYAVPNAMIGGDMKGMQPGARLSVLLDLSPLDSNTYRVDLEAIDGMSARVSLTTVDRTLGIATQSSSGPIVPVPILQRAFAMSLRAEEGRLLVDLDRNRALDVPLPSVGLAGEGGALSIKTSAPGGNAGYPSRIRLDFVDLREADGVPNVTVDRDSHVLFSLVQPGLLETFDGLSWLNAFDGDVLELEEFVTDLLPVFEIQSLGPSHLLLRSTVPASPEALISLVFDGQHETVRVAPRD